MIALAVAMFAVFQSAQADGHRVSLAFDDSDGIVSDGDDVKVTVTVTIDSTQAPSVAANLDWVRVSGELDGAEHTNAAGTADQNDVVSSGDGAWAETATGSGVWKASFADVMIINPKGTSHGEYTVSARVSMDTDNTTNATDVSVGSKVLTVGDAGVAVASAEIGLSTVGVVVTPTEPETYLDPGESAPHTKGNPQDSDSAKKGTPIYLSVTVLNSLGEAADNRDVKSVSIIAATGSLGRGANAPATADSLSYTTDSEDEAGNDAMTDALAVTQFSVTKATAGTLDVYAVVVGTTGAATTDTFTLTFTGDAKVITLHDPSSPLGAGGSATVDVTATDDAGNVASLNPDQISANVLSDPGARFTETPNQAPKAGKDFMTDPPAVATEGSPTDAETAALAAHDASDCDGMNGDAECDPNKVRVTIAAAAGTPAGEYTLQVKLGTDDTQEITIIVAGAPDALALESTHETVSVGDIITITATVTDADGHPVVNAGTDDGVSFEAVGSLKLSALRDDDRAKDNDIMVALKDGSASARFLVSQGSGTASIVAEYTAGTASVDAVISVSTEAAEAMPEEEASVACLSNLAGFATWACGVESSASEIFGLVSGRGATALHLWNGSAWVRYSVVDGTMVPGSSDFMVAENDILYISN